MILVKEQLLHFKSSTSDKVYEVALFKLGENEFVVNFKFGRRGNTLQEGTKTVYPVSLDAAESIYEKLINQKLAKGYRHITDRNDLELSIEEIPSSENRLRANKVSSYLEAFANGTPPAINWRLSRIIWRAGELRLVSALPAVRRLLPSLTGQEKYAAIWYLGRLKHTDAQQILESIDVDDRALSRHIYSGALAAFGEPQTISSIINGLPSQLQSLYLQRQYDEYMVEANEMLYKLKTTNNQYLFDTYLLTLTNNELKQQFSSLLNRVLPEPNYWKYVRYIFKVAEMLDDAPTLGQLAMMLVRNIAGVNSTYVNVRGRYQHRREELSKPDAQIAFSKLTKNYFIRRIIRNLERNGKLGNAYYCELATAILTSIHPEDGLLTRREYHYVPDPETNRYRREERCYTQTAHIPYLYEILYAGGSTFEMNGTNDFYQRSDSPIQSREDKYPHLWNKNARQIVALIAHGKIDEVVLSGILMSKDVTDFNSLIEIDDLKNMVSNPYQLLIEFTSNHIRTSYSSNNCPPDVINLLLRSKISSYHDLALSLTKPHFSAFESNEEGVIAAMMLQHKPWHEWLRQHISDSNLSEEAAQIIADGVVSELGKTPIQDLSELTLDTLFHCFHKTVSHTSIETINALLKSPDEIKQVLGARLMTVKNIPSHQWPDHIITTLLVSENEIVRSQGMNLVIALSDAELLNKDDLLTTLMTSELRDLRIKSKEIIGRLAPNNDFRDKMFLRLYPTLLKNQEDETLPEDIHHVIDEYLHQSLPLLLPNIENVLLDNHRETHLLTWRLLTEYAELTKWPISLIALMGHHDMKQIRELAMNYFDANVARIKEYKHDALLILASNWSEVQSWATQYFDKNFNAQDWTPALIVSLCDSVHLYAQQYGIRLLSKFFNSDDGVLYLTQLSEHPNENIQLYTTNYLDKYAYNNLSILNKLMPYFKTVLMAINKNSASKARVFRFIKKQITEGHEYAELFAPLLNDLVQTIAIMNKADVILLLNTIKTTYPHIDVELEQVPISLRKK